MPKEAGIVSATAKACSSSANSVSDCYSKENRPVSQKGSQSQTAGAEWKSPAGFPSTPKKLPPIREQDYTSYYKKKNYDPEVDSEEYIKKKQTWYQRAMAEVLADLGAGDDEEDGETVELR